jgi:hypothetical protein
MFEMASGDLVFVFRSQARVRTWHNDAPERNSATAIEGIVGNSSRGADVAHDVPWDLLSTVKFRNVIEPRDGAEIPAGPRNEPLPERSVLVSRLREHGHLAPAWRAPDAVLRRRLPLELPQHRPSTSALGGGAARGNETRPNRERRPRARRGTASRTLAFEPVQRFAVGLTLVRHHRIPRRLTKSVRPRVLASHASCLQSTLPPRPRGRVPPSRRR